MKGACRERVEGRVILGPPGTGQERVGSPIPGPQSLSLTLCRRAGGLISQTQLSSPYSTLGKK